MYQLNDLKDTIVAISTPAGYGGIGIIRLSGDNALAITDKLFRTKNNVKPSEVKSFTVHYGWVIKDDEIVDEALLTVMRAPKSYTKEDVVEISCHAGVVALKTVVSLATDLGARLAEPGEFTKRAFLNGRIDLTQAEAVLDIIQSKTDAFLRVSTNQLKGELSEELEAIRSVLMNIYVEIEAVINFPEDDIDAAGRKRINKEVKSVLKKVEKLLASSEHGRILKEGIKIVICGKPNVGKSSLLNVLLKQPRAIVSNVPGTTRDTIEETAQIKGIPFQLIDTAGILEPRDLIEQEAIRRSHMYIDSADLVILILDGSQKFSDEDETLIKHIHNRNVFVVINKSDLKQKLNLKEVNKHFKKNKVLKVSALKKTGIKKLEDSIIENVWHESKVDAHGIMLSNIRHIDALKESRASLENALSSLKEDLSFEFISEQIKESVNLLDKITGRNIDSDLLESIFSQFCIGK